MDIRTAFTTARLRGVPITVIGTADQWATVEELRELPDVKDCPLVRWDAARGITALNKQGEDALKAKKITPADTVGFVAAMLAVGTLPAKSIVFAHNAGRQLVSQEPGATAEAVQAVSNLRDELKQNFRMLVVLGPGTAVPMELAQDVVILHHALPKAEELGKVVDEICAAAKKADKKFHSPDAKERAKAVEAILGLSRFAAEQVTAMSVTDTHLDIDQMWERKRIAIEQTPGLKVWRGKERFADVVGLDAYKADLQDEIDGQEPIGVVVFVDEIDKAMANTEADGTGVRTDQMRTMLTEMEDNGWRGSVGLGVGGTGKSFLAKAFANEAGVPCIVLDLAGMESKYVGESEANLRHAMAVIKAVGNGNAYFIATSNNATVMRPELQRRFTNGMWMFDVPGPEQRAAAWAFYMKKYGLKEQPLPEDDGWTPAEVRNCCRKAWNAKKPLVEASRSVLPMSRSRATEIEALRKYADGRLLDATNYGSYKYDARPMEKQVRAIAFPALDMSGATKVN